MSVFYACTQVTPFLSRRGYNSTKRAEISPAERLAVTLRFLATGNSQVCVYISYCSLLQVAFSYTFTPQVSMSFNFRMGRSTIHSVLLETCSVLWTVLSEQYVRAPSSPDEWKDVSRDFFSKWNFPHCVGELAAGRVWV